MNFIGNPYIERFQNWLQAVPHFQNCTGGKIVIDVIKGSITVFCLNCNLEAKVALQFHPTAPISSDEVLAIHEKLKNNKEDLICELKKKSLSQK